MHPEERKPDCKQAEALFSAFMEGELSEGEAAAMKEHLDSCKGCEAGYKGFREAVEALASYRPDSVPRTFIEEVSEAVRLDEALRRRRWPLVLSWCVTAAAVVAAIFTWLSGPEVIEVEKPVERVVVKEKEVPVHIPVEKEVPVYVEVKVPVPAPVSVPVKSGTLEVIRNNETIRIAAGESHLFLRGDILRAVEKEAPAPPPAPPLEIVFDFDSLASVIQHVSQDLKQVARAAMERNPPVPSPDFTEEPVKTVPPVALVWESDGVLVLETSGSDPEVIPELIHLLDNPNPQISAAATGRLETIQDRLFERHGIQAPLQGESEVQRSGPYEDLIAFFGEDREESYREYSDAERWERWWASNSAPIQRLARLGSE